MARSRLVEFVCNMPGPTIELAKTLVEIGPLGTSCKPRVFVEVQPNWTRVGDNFIGDPHGKHIKGDQGIYVIPEKEWLFPERILDWKPWEGVENIPIGECLLFEVYDGVLKYHTGRFGLNNSQKPVGTIGCRFHFDHKIKRWARIQHLLED